MNTTSSVITIGREYGSAGRQIGQEVAKYFGIKCYDKELLELAAKESGKRQRRHNSRKAKAADFFVFIFTSSHMKKHTPIIV